MQAEQLLDSIVQLTGVAERFAGWVPARRAMALPHGSPGELLPVFGRVADREFIRERDSDPNITQTLHLMNAEAIQKRFSSPSGNLTRWLKESEEAGSDTHWVERLYLAALCRPPRPDELQSVTGLLRAAPRQRRAIVEDLAWALVNSKEFLYVH
jgi:hypothetical protein